MVLTQRLRKSGNSYVVTVPPEEVERLGLTEGEFVGVEVRKLSVRPVLPPDLQEAAEQSWAKYENLYYRLRDH